MHGERHVVERVAARSVGARHGQVVQFEHRDIGDRALAGLRGGEFAADHHLGQFAGGDRARIGDLADGAALADHRDRVGVFEHLVELVGDEDDRGALLGELAQRCEELVDLLGHEHGGRLVEDEDLGAAIEHLENLDALFLADAEVGDQSVGVDVEAVLFAEFDDAVAGLLDPEGEGAAGLVAEHDVLPHRQVGGEHERLEDHADALARSRPSASGRPSSYR